jgi:poly(beta-D-mannuronate) lyase
MAMLRIVLCLLMSVGGLAAMARTIPVDNAEALKKANAGALPGDTIVLRNGEWKDVPILLNGKGTAAAPIVVKAQTSGKVLITGHSTLRIGGSYIIVDGFFFVNGYSGDEATITFRSNKNEVANHCRVTNTAIDDFNNPKRLDENYWVALYGKNNRVDHCSFLHKKNIGVLLAVILDDERSRENFHLIDHNYFGTRPPLASNGGEIIRVGVSEHCQFNSNTQITDNFFEYCDGETEIISIKSCQNLVRNNLFKECQGSVVLRHGNYNTVESNVFWGNKKAGTGGVRIINKGNWVINNFFYQCRGEGFRSPLSIMNGIPNSPANRYLEVSEAVIANNSFYECSPFSLCEGSDAERTVAPYKVQFINNLFYNTKDTLLYQAYDNIGGIHFAGNLASATIRQPLGDGFTKTALSTSNAGAVMLPNAGMHHQHPLSDSLQSLARGRLINRLSAQQGVSDTVQVQKIMTYANGCGATWFKQKKTINKQVRVNCKNAAEMVQQLAANKGNKLLINLTGNNYLFGAPLNIGGDVVITTQQKKAIQFVLPVFNARYFIQLQAGGSLSLHHLNLDLSAATTFDTFITTDTSGSSHHSNFSLYHCSINNGNNTFFTAAKSSLLDSIIIRHCRFSNNSGALFLLQAEVDKKGYYNVEQLKITNSHFTHHKGPLLALLRSGKDESTMGPRLVFAHNKIENCSTANDEALLHIAGVQQSFVEKNSFTNSNAAKKLIVFEDWVRAVHVWRKNRLVRSGEVVANQYVAGE